MNDVLAEKLRATMFFVQSNENLSRWISNVLPQFNWDDMFSSDSLGSYIQESIDAGTRKRLAINYTLTSAAAFLGDLIGDYHYKHVLDPFAGSARLIRELALRQGHESKTTANLVTFEVSEIWEPAAKLSILHILYLITSKKVSQQLRFIISLGDTFEMFQRPSRADLVIMNPPFTRYLRLGDNYLKRLKIACKDYESFFSDQMGLHIFSLFLADRCLSRGGMLAAILPASTFYSLYSEGLRRFLLHYYTDITMVGVINEMALSERSDFREVFLIARKAETENIEDSAGVSFISLGEITQSVLVVGGAERKSRDRLNAAGVQKRIIPTADLYNEWNWIRFLEQNSLYELADTLKIQGNLRTSQELGLRIVRGFEMYGPNFFFLPNKYWSITSQEDDVTIVTHDRTQTICKIPSTILASALRKSGLYSTQISPKIDHFALFVPDGKHNVVPQEYIDLSSSEWEVAHKRFGNNWIHHTYRQLRSKSPSGYLFVVDKIPITRIGTFIHYYDMPVICSKNFHLIGTDQRRSKLLAAWMSSTFFLLLFLSARREIGGNYGRLQIIDYLREPFFLEVDEILPTQEHELLRTFDLLRAKQLPSLRQQVKSQWKPRVDLDRTILSIVKVWHPASDLTLETLYNEVNRAFILVDARTRRGRSLLPPL